MILELDLGNTRCKWRLVDNGQVVERGNEAWQSLPEAVPIARRIRVASVLSEQKEQELATRLQATSGVAPEFAQSTARCAGVENGYRRPGELGVDRWLALLAAYRLAKGSVLVVSAGTAVTLDELDSSGRHLGGYILPGPQLMLESLQARTDRVRFDAAFWRFEAGFETGECVSAGVALALVGAVMAASQSGVPLVLTGGNAALVADGLAQRGVATELVPELILDGLQLALP